MTKVLNILGGLLLCLQVFAADKPKIRSLEVELGTKGRLAWEFHQLVEDRYGFGLRYPGYIIGIEKAVRHKIGVVAREKLDSQIKIKSVSKIERLHLLNWLNDAKRTFVSHIVKYDIIHPDSNNELARLRSTHLYSVYQEMIDKKAKVADSYRRSWVEIKALYSRLESQIKNEKYTHIILLSMGWNTDQQEAIRNFNSLMGNLLEHAYRKKNVRFKPLVIGITWPSKWYVPGVSIGNKVHDADEIGVVWINLLLNRVVLPLKEKTGVKVVLVGHSLGARALTRAVFSEKLLPDSPKFTHIKSDLVVGLQGAFSINRFIKDKGVEGFPYITYENKARKFVMTWSRHDSATPVLKYLANINLIGSKWGYKTVKRLGYENIFELLTPDHAGSLELKQVNSKKILYIDASSIIKYRRYRKYGKAHNDLYTPAIGKLLWDLIRYYTIEK